MPRIFDLTREIYHRMRVSPTYQTPLICDHLTHTETLAAYGGRMSWAAKALAFSDHTGTHVDAFNHMNPTQEAESIDQLPIERFYGNAICLDASYKGAGGIIQVSDIEQELRRTGLEIRKGDNMLFRSAHYYPPEGRSAFLPPHEQAADFEQYMRGFPGLSGEAVHWLADRGVNMVGLEGRSVDSPANERSDSPECFPAHKACFERRVLAVENLAIPAELVGKRFTYIGFPLKLRGATGSPIRAVAVLNDR
jgi:kynurenine formamidase